MPDWTCSLFVHRERLEGTAPLQPGDTVDAWIVHVDRERKNVSASISNFGKFPPRPAHAARYIEALLSISSYVQKGVVEPYLAKEHVSEVKGLANRCVRKDQWDWFLIFRALEMEDDDDALALADAIHTLRRGTWNKDTDATTSSLHALDTWQFPRRARAAAKLLAHCTYSADIVRSPSPRPEQKGSPENEERGPSDDRQAEAATIEGSLETAILCERANHRHELLVRAMATELAARGRTPRSTRLIDLFYVNDAESVIFEMKTITSENATDQIRKAIAQLYEYRYFHNMRSAHLCIVLDRGLKSDKLLDYIVDDRNLMICWWEYQTFRFPYQLHGRIPWLQTAAK